MAQQALKCLFLIFQRFLVETATLKQTRIPRIGSVACLKRQPFDMKKEKQTLVLIITPIPKGNPSLQISNEINASLQKLLWGNNIFTLYFTPTTKTKLKKGHNSAKIWRLITNIELYLYFTMVYPANFQ